MNVFLWIWEFFFPKKKKKENSVADHIASINVIDDQYRKFESENKTQIRRVPHYESPHVPVEKLRRKEADDSLVNDILIAGIATTIFDDSTSSYDSGSNSSYSNDSHSSHSTGFDGGFGGGDYSGGGSGGDWGSSSDSSYDSGSSYND